MSQQPPPAAPAAPAAEPTPTKADCEFAQRVPAAVHAIGALAEGVMALTEIGSGSHNVMVTGRVGVAEP